MAEVVEKCFVFPLVRNLLFQDNVSFLLQAMRKNKEMENISFFLKAAEGYGVSRGDLFQVNIVSCISMLQSSRKEQFVACFRCVVFTTTAVPS